LSRNLGALTSWNPLGHSRPVMGLLYLYLFSVRVLTPLTVQRLLYDLDDLEVGDRFQVSISKRIFCFPSARSRCGAHPISYRNCFSDRRAVETLRRPLTSFSVKVGNKWIYTSITSYKFMAWCLMTNNFTVV